MSDLWIEWNGGECPVPDGTLVDVMYRSGCKGYGLPANEYARSSGYEASQDFWNNDGDYNDIVAYRLSEQSEVRKLTGGSSGYYRVKVHNPTTLPEAYEAECNDIIEALDMTFAEGNAFKAIWRSAAARQGNGKPGTTAKYDAEKVIFFGGRMLVKAEVDDGQS